MATAAIQSPEASCARPKAVTQPAEDSKSLIQAIKKTAFVVGTALIIFAAARNTITWHVEKLWGASGDFWQTRWQQVHALFGGNSFLLTVYGTNVVNNLVFWGFSAFFLICDITGKPQWMLQYKIQDANQPVDRKKLLRAVKFVLFNHTIVTLAFSYVLYPVYVWRGCSTGLELPSFQWVLFEIAVFTMIEEIGFYYSHRLFHHPAIYKYVHKQHHEWTAPIGIVAIYAHPLEHIVSNLGPISAGPLIMGSHLATTWLWFSIALTSTIISHSGYHLPFLPSPEAHDFHHLKFTNNFGVLGVLDRLHGTDLMFRQSKAYDRHIMLLGATPLRETFPDDPKNNCRKGK